MYGGCLFRLITSFGDQEVEFSGQGNSVVMVDSVVLVVEVIFIPSDPDIPRAKRNEAIPVIHLLKLFPFVLSQVFSQLLKLMEIISKVVLPELLFMMRVQKLVALLH